MPTQFGVLLGVTGGELRLPPAYSLFQWLVLGPPIV